MRKFLTVIFTFFVLASSFSVFAQDETRASKTWEVRKYNITATLPPSETDRYLPVKAILDLKNVSSVAASRLTLRISPSAEISAVKINDATADFTKGEEKIGGNRNLQKVVVRIPSVSAGANFSISVDYKLKVEENSGLNSLSPIGAQFLPLSFWYPTPNSWYFPRGADFAPMRLQINSASSEKVIASGVITGNAFEQKLFDQPFFVSGNWDNVNFNNPTFNAEGFIPKGSDLTERKNLEEMFRLVLSAKDFVTGVLGELPNFPPLRIVAVSRGAGFSSGGTIFIEESAFRRSKIDSQAAMTIVESIAKLWIGNAVLVSGDGNGVVREGLPRFIATQFLEKHYGKDIANIERLRQRASYASIVQRDAPLNIVSPIDDYYYPAVSNKGAMIWRLLANRVGQNEFFNGVRTAIKDGSVDLAKLRSAFPAQKDFLDYSFDTVTDTNLLVGLPQTNNAETKIALRNAGSFETTVNVAATTASGEKLNAQTTIPAKSFGEVTFKTAGKIARVEVDADKFYPQIDYSDDVAPRELTSSDPISFIKRAFDQQDFVKAENNARLVLRDLPQFEDARIWLARSLLAQGKNSDAEKEFRAVLDEKLPTARSLSWANAGLGDIALKAGQIPQANRFFEEAIKNDAEYGASLAARQGRNKSNNSATIDESVKAFFAQFDKAVISARKSELDAMILSGEIPKFSGGSAGQAEQWQTKVLFTDKINANTVWAEVSLNIKLLNKSAETGTAVFRLTRVGNNWKLSGVDIFEVR